MILVFVVSGVRVCTCVNADEGSPVEVVSAAHGPAALLRTKHLQPHAQTLLHHTVLTAAPLAAAPRAALEQPDRSRDRLTAHMTDHMTTARSSEPRLTLRSRARSAAAVCTHDALLRLRASTERTRSSARLRSRPCSRSTLRKTARR